MQVSFGDKTFDLTVPDDAQAGDTIEVSLLTNTDDDLMIPLTPLTASVIVPDGCLQGDEFTVEMEGRRFTIGVPDGCKPGDEIQIEIPSGPEDEPWGVEPSGAEPEQLVGRRVELCGLVAKGILNGRKGTVRACHADLSQLVCSIDGMCPDVHVKPEHVRALPDDDEPDPDHDEPPEAPPAGAHYVGDRVLVERSSGRTSLATIVEYDEVMETYVIDVGRGVLKYGVEESYITPYETSDVWAGPETRVHGRWEGFFVGRRVRIPAMNSSSDDDREGEVRGYDKATGFYHVLLDSGTMRRSVLHRNVKVTYQLRDEEIYS